MKKALLVALSLVAALVVLGGCTGPKDLDLDDDTVADVTAQ